MSKVISCLYAKRNHKFSDSEVITPTPLVQRLQDLFLTCKLVKFSYLDHYKNGIHNIIHDLKINNNIYSSCMRSKVISTCTCVVFYRGEDTNKHSVFSCPHFDKQRMEIDDKMCTALPNWPSFDISTKLLQDLQCPDYLFQTCYTYVHEL